MFSYKKLTRAWGVICIRYPIFQIFNNNKLSKYIIVGYLILICYAILWGFGIPQKTLNLSDTAGMTAGLFTTLIEISALLILGISTLLWKVIASSENTRISNINAEIPDSLIVKIKPYASVKLKFDSTKHYNLPPILEACYRWVEFDRDEYFLVEAGSLDIPKISVNSFKINTQLNTVQINLGSSSFYDIFYTHYSPDLSLSGQSTSEQNKSLTTLRSLLDHSLSRFYNEQTNISNEEKKINCSQFLPNPLGLSGIVLLSTDTETLVLLRKRGSHEIAAKNKLEWSFAGLIEATFWIHNKEINFTDFVNVELQDEVTTKIKSLASRTADVYPIGIVFNKLYLYQPEIFATVHYNNLTKTEMSDIRKECRNYFVISSIHDLEKTFATHDVKNLCTPGLKLLQAAYPDFFITLEANLSTNKHNVKQNL